MIRIIWASAILLILLGAVETHGQTGRLQGVRDASSNTGSPSSSTGAGETVGDFVSGVFSSDTDLLAGTAIVGLAALAPFLGPLLLLDDGYSNRMYFAPYPYAGSYPGYQLLSANAASRLADAESKDLPRNDWAFRVLLENGNDFNGLNRVGGQFKVENANRWGVITNWNYYHENLAGGGSDETVMGDTNLTFRFAQNETTSFYAGLGVRVLTDRHQTDVGFNFTYGGDWFPVRPFVVSGIFDAGTLGEAGVIHARGTVGATWHGVEIFAGYDFLRIGGTNLQGPMAGMRFWF